MLSSSKKFWLGIIAPMVVIVAMLSAAATQTGCGGAGGGLFPTVNPSASPTPTTCPSTGVFLYSTNLGDGKVAEFQRNTSTGGLCQFGTVNAGASNSTDGPLGITITPNKQFVYVANSADGNVYEYSIQSSTGNLLLIGSIAAGGNPQQVVTDTTGSFLYVSNYNGGSNGSISIYTINSSSGALTLFGTFHGSGFVGPKGMAVSGSELFVADFKGGSVWPLLINSNGALAQLGSPVPSLGTQPGNPTQLAVSGNSLYATDITNSVVSLFLIQSSGALSFASSANSGASPVGIGAATANSTSYVFSANLNSISEFINSNFLLIFSNQVSNAQGPNGIAIDPLQAFLYTANTRDGTIGLFQIGANCASAPLCPVTSFPTESVNSNPQYIVMTN